MRDFFSFVLLKYSDTVGSQVCLEGGHYDHVIGSFFPPGKIPQYFHSSASSEIPFGVGSEGPSLGETG